MRFLPPCTPIIWPAFTGPITTSLEGVQITVFTFSPKPVTGGNSKGRLFLFDGCATAGLRFRFRRPPPLLPERNTNCFCHSRFWPSSRHHFSKSHTYRLSDTLPDKYLYMIQRSSSPTYSRSFNLPIIKAVITLAWTFCVDHSYSCLPYRFLHQERGWCRHPSVQQWTWAIMCKLVPCRLNKHCPALKWPFTEHAAEQTHPSSHHRKYHLPPALLEANQSNVCPLISLLLVSVVLLHPRAVWLIPDIRTSRCKTWGWSLSPSCSCIVHCFRDSGGRIKAWCCLTHRPS